MEINFSLKGLIEALGVDGFNTKAQVREALQNASIKELSLLKRSIQEEINRRKEREK